MRNNIRVLQVPDGIRHQINAWKDIQKLQEKAKKSVEALKASSIAASEQPQIRASDDFNELLKALEQTSVNKEEVGVCDTDAVIRAIESSNVETPEPADNTEQEETVHVERVTETIESPPNQTIEEVEDTAEQEPASGEEDDIGLPQLGKKYKHKKEKVVKHKKDRKPLFQLFKRKQNKSEQTEIIDNDELGLPSLHDKSSLIFDIEREEITEEEEIIDTGDLGDSNIIEDKQEDNIDDMYAHSVKRQGFINVSLGGDVNE